MSKDKFFVIPNSIINVNREDYSIVDACVSVARHDDESILYEMIDYMTDDIFESEEEYIKEIDRLSTLGLKLLETLTPHLRDVFKRNLDDNYELNDIHHYNNITLVRFSYYE